MKGRSECPSPREPKNGILSEGNWNIFTDTGVEGALLESRLPAQKVAGG
jgi:hypothetical protein